MALHHPVGHPSFVKYPDRWLLEINDCIIDSTKSKSALENLVKTSKAFVQEAEHMPPDVLGHFMGVLLWSSYHLSSKDFIGTVRFLHSETFTCHIPSMESTPLEVSKTIVQIINSLGKSTHTKNSYFKDVLDLLYCCFRRPTLSRNIYVTEVLSRTFKVSNSLQRALDCAYELYSSNKVNCALKLLQVLVSSKVLPFLQIGLWNVSVIKDWESGRVEALLMCLESHPQACMIDIGCHLVNHEVSYPVVCQQLAVYYHKVGKLAACRNYCQTLLDLFSTSLICIATPELEHAAVVYKNDLAYLSADTEVQQELLHELQSYELDNILSEISTSSYQAQTLALCCVLLTQSFSHLDRNDLQSGYEYFNLSYKKSSDLKGDIGLYYVDMKNRFLGQLNSLKGYFELLEGNYDGAALSYGVSYAYDGTLILSLYNQCLLLIKIGKVLEAKSNWKSVTMHHSHPDGSFQKLNLYFDGLTG